MLRALSPLAAGGVVAAIVLGGYGAAAAATGNVFILGRSNTESSMATLSNSHGTPLSLRAPGGLAPLKVNSAVQVKNLNASLLGGMPAGAFDQGGTQTRAYGFTLNSFQTNMPLLNVPGVGQVQAYCAPSADDASVQLKLSVESADEMLALSTSTGSLSFFSRSVGAPDLLGLANATDATGGQAAGGWSSIVLRYTTGSGSKVATHVATVDALVTFDTGTCDYDVSASVGPGLTSP
jgi:hypothetical protein